MSYDGPDRRAPVHPWRWRALTLWIVVFTAVVLWAIITLRNTQTNFAAERAANRARFVASDYELCVRPLVVVQRILLQSLGIDPAAYQKRPVTELERAIARLYRDRPQQAASAQRRSAAILALADPAACKALPSQHTGGG